MQEHATHQCLVENLSDGGIKQVKNDQRYHRELDAEIYMEILTEDNEYYNELNHYGRDGVSHEI
jgi:hypothetical protein